MFKFEKAQLLNTDKDSLINIILELQDAYGRINLLYGG